MYLQYTPKRLQLSFIIRELAKKIPKLKKCRTQTRLQINKMSLNHVICRNQYAVVFVHNF